MLRLTLAQMRRSLGRLTAAGVAILIGTAFVTVTLLAGNVITGTTYDSIAAQYVGADLVVSDFGGTDDDVAALREVDGVRAAAPEVLSFQQLQAAGRTVYQGVVPLPSDPGLLPLDVAEGALPAWSGEIALPIDLANRLGAAPGDTITLVRNALVDPSTGEMREEREQLTVSGTVDDPYGAYAIMGGAAIAPAADVARWEAEQRGPDEPARYPAALVALDDGADLEAARTALAAAVAETGAQVVTPHEHAETVAAAMTGGEDVIFTTFVLVFAAVALLVAALVIANTFQVLVAQRTRTLALLRCVGADKGQLRRSVLVEAGILGVASSLAGIVVGAALAQLALVVGRGFDIGVPLPATISLTPAVVLVPLAVGTLVTLVAALSPARAATRVAPLEALRPADAPSAARGAGRVRLVLSTLTALAGFAALGAGVALGTTGGEPTLGLLVAVGGGALSFVGVLVGAVFWLPKVVSFAGRLVGASGPTARLAAANTLRNPRRTAATSTALLIGVTLVAMMSTGAESARASMDAELDARYPVDVLVATDGSVPADEAPAVSADVRAAVADADGVRAVVDVATTSATLGGGGGTQGAEVAVRGVDPEAADGVLRSTEMVAPLAQGTAVVPEELSDAIGIADGDVITLAGADGSAALTARVTDLADDALLVVPADLASLDGNAATTRLWVAIEDPSAATTVVPGIQDAVSLTGEPVEVAGAAVERAGFEQVIDTVLGIVIGLLAVAVVIALIGVANTLSLSVIERRRESATLRAIGLTRGQLRGTLAIEGVLIAGVGAVLGILLGVVYGWAGATTALGWAGDVVLAVPWRDVALVLLVAVVAGLVASVVPARAAARTSPVEALATE
jgi:putative ABC transport system permease protein